MGLSETILAASIGAAATVSTALFQLFSALRANNGRMDARPKRGSTLKSIMAVVALMIVSGVGGFLFSEFRSERSANDLHSMRDDINAKLQVLADTTSRIAARDIGANASSIPTPAAAIQAPMQTLLAPTSVESVVYAPACQAGAACTEANSQPMALCGAIPSTMQAHKFDLFIKNASAAEVSKADFEQDLGGAKFQGPPAEYPQGENRKAVCINFLHWSDQPHIATLILQYGVNADAGPTTVQQVSPATVVATQPSLPSTHAVSVTAANAAL